MTRSWTGYLAGAAFALSAAATGIACAQATPADAQREAQHDAATADSAHVDHMHMERAERPDRVDRMERHVVIRDGDRHGHMDMAEHLRTMLQLKPSQEPALTAYIAAVKPAHGHEQIVEMADHDGAKTTPQRLSEMEAHMAEQAAQGHARIEATRKFYNQLEPSQKKVFDEMPMMMIGPMGPMMNMGNMRVLVNMQGVPPMPPLPPLPPVPPVPPRL
jgi:hypothetical protein